MSAELPEFGSEQISPYGGREHLVDQQLGNEEFLRIYVNNAYGIYKNVPFYGTDSRAGFICGPAHSVYARLLSLNTGIPLQQGGDDEHLELCIGYYWPDDDEERASDHTYIKYHTGQGYTAYIDVVYPLLWASKSVYHDPVQDFVNYRLYPDAAFADGLATEYRLYEFDATSPQSVWNHPFIGYDFPDIETVRQVSRDINVPDLNDIPDWEWKSQAVKDMAAYMDIYEGRWTGKYVPDVRGVSAQPYSRPGPPDSQQLYRRTSARGRWTATALSERLARKEYQRVKDLIARRAIAGNSLRSPLGR